MRRGGHDAEIELLLRAIDDGFDHAAWHGPNLRGSLRGLSAEQAAWRPARGRHNIWELAIHAAYWKYAVRRRLVGGKRGNFTLRGSNWFLRDYPSNQKAWHKDLALLDEEHRLLRTAVAQVDPSKLHQRPSRKGRPLIDYVLGIAFHDVYHAGQVRLLKRLRYESRKKTR